MKPAPPFMKNRKAFLSPTSARTLYPHFPSPRQETVAHRRRGHKCSRRAGRRGLLRPCLTGRCDAGTEAPATGIATLDASWSHA